MTLVLASRSPQRRAILTQLGLEFRVVEPSYDELPLPVPAARAGRAAQPRQGALGRGGRGGDGARSRHPGRDRRPGARQARGRSRGGAHAGPPGRQDARGRVRPDAARHCAASAPRTPARPCASGRSTPRPSTSTSRAANGAVAQVAMPFRRRVPHSCRTSTDASSTSWASRLRCWSRCWASPVAPFPAEE